MDSYQLQRRHYAKIYNFPNRMDNLRARIAELRDEAQELGYRDEVAHLSALLALAESRDLTRITNEKHEWTMAEVQVLRRMWADGCSGGQIAKALGRSRSAVLAAARRNDLHRRRYD